MNLEIVAKNNLEISETTRKQAEKKIGKLDRYLPSITEGKVEISREGAKLPQQRLIVQVTLNSKGTLIRAQEKAEDVRTAIDKVVNVLTGRIERYKGRLYEKGRGVSLARQGATVEMPELESPKKIVRNKHFLLKPLPEDEAIDQMELLGHDFFLFINATTDKLNLLYRRKDGNYGIIEPEMAQD